MATHFILFTVFYLFFHLQKGCEMKLVFMGTPEFSATILTEILNSEHQVVGVVTQPDRPAGRGHKLKAPPVKVIAKQANIPVLQTEDLQHPDFLAQLQELEADLYVVVAFSILPKCVLEIPPLGSVNLHGSLLPKYRGAAPIQWAIANGESETGITIFQLDEKMDHGPILCRARLPIAASDHSGSLFAKMAELGKKEMLRALAKIASGNFQTLEQNHSEATRAPKLKKIDGLLDWSKSAENLSYLIRAFFPWPCCYGSFRGKGFKILEAKVGGETPFPSNLKLGELYFSENKELFVKVGDGLLQILSLQLEGKKPMTPAEFYNGLQDRGNLILE